MKALIFSDVHGAKKRLVDILETHTDVDYRISLGDHELNQSFLNDYQIIAVKGNYPMDVGIGYDHVLNIGNKHVLITHGHHYWIKSGYDMLLSTMRKNNIDVCFHGHSHEIAFYQSHLKTIINPGAVSFARGKETESYCVVEVLKAQWRVTWYDARHHTKIKEEHL